MRGGSGRADLCFDQMPHSWVLRDVRGHDEVYCARCMRCLGTEQMLRAYVELHGGEMRRG